MTHAVSHEVTHKVTHGVTHGGGAPNACVVGHFFLNTKVTHGRGSLFFNKKVTHGRGSLLSAYPFVVFSCQTLSGSARNPTCKMLIRFSQLVDDVDDSGPIGILREEPGLHKFRFLRRSRTAPAIQAKNGRSQLVNGLGLLCRPTCASRGPILAFEPKY